MSSRRSPSPGGEYARYDQYVNAIANNKPKWLPFIFHVLQENYDTSAQDIKFQAKYYPQLDAKYSTTPSAAGELNEVFHRAMVTVDRVLKPNVNLSSLQSLRSQAGWFNQLVERLYDATTGNRNRASFLSESVVDYDVLLTATPAALPRGWLNATVLPNTMLAVTENIGVKVDKYLLTLLLDNAYQAVKSGQPTSAKFFATQASFNDEKFYYRKPDQPGKLFMLKNGVETEVQKGSKDYLEGHNKGDNCYDLGFTGTSTGFTCDELVQNCLAGKNIDQCKAYMTNGGWWKETNDVNKLNPALAMDMLSKFGFGIVENDVREVGLRLRQVMTTTQWLERLNNEFKGKGLGSADISKISSNTRLIGYLDRVVNKINSNPAVLNKNYNGPQTLSTNPNAFQGSTLSKFGLKPKQVISGSGVPSLSSIVALQNTVLRARSNIGVLYGINALPTGLIYQRGGAEAFEFMEAYGDDNRLPLRLSKIIKDAFESFVNSLKANGKDLDSNDKTHIDKLVQDLDKYENKLLKSAVYTDKYIKLLQVYGQTDSSSVLSMDHIQKFVDNRNNYFTKVSKKQDELLSILKAMADATNTEVKSEVKSVTEYGKWE